MHPHHPPRPRTGEDRRNVYACLFTGVILLLAVCLAALLIAASLWVVARAWTMIYPLG